MMTKDEIIKYIVENELESARAKISFLFADLVYTGYVESEDVVGSSFGPVFGYFWKDGATPSFYQILTKSKVLAPTQKVYDDFQLDPNSLDKKIADHVRLEGEMERLGRKALLPGEKIVDSFGGLVDISTAWWKIGAIGEDKGSIIQDELVPKFAEKHNLDISSANEIFNILSHPEEQTVLNQARELFLQICLGKCRGDDISALVQKYEQKFYWFGTDFYNSQLFDSRSFLETVESEIGLTGEKGIIQELAKIRDGFARIGREKLELQKKYRLDANDLSDIGFAKKITWWVDLRKRGMSKDCYYVFQLLSQVANDHKIDYEDLSYYHIEEISDLIRNGIKIDDAEIARRQRGIFVIWEKGCKTVTFYDNDAEELLKKCLGADTDEILRGNVASRGGVEKITGRVSVVHQPNHDVFDDGDILVTSMTRVEFVPLMRRAKAIVTDEGGIACHAAIVSRELGLPCIIGTKKGTRILKNGDLVEIDTTTGTIKVFDRK